MNAIRFLITIGLLLTLSLGVVTTAAHTGKATATANTVKTTTTSTTTVPITSTITTSTVSSTSTTTTIKPTKLMTVAISPVSNTIAPDSSLKITATVKNGVKPYTYQWYNDTTGTGIAISGATNSFYKFHSVYVGTYRYYVTVKDSGSNTITSNVASVTTNTYTYVTLSPSPASVVRGNGITITANVYSNNPDWTVTWYFGANAITACPKITVSNALVNPKYFTCSIPANVLTKSETVRFNLNDADEGLIFNSLDSITVTTNTIPLLHLNPPGPAHVDIGQKIPLRAWTSNAVATQYKWYNITSGHAVLIATTTTNTITINALSTGSKFYTYYVTATTNKGTLISNNAIIHIYPAFNGLAITVSPPTATINTGQNQTFTANVANVGGTGSFLYQWYNDSTGTPVAITGANTIAYTVFGNSAGAYSYFIMITDQTHVNAKPKEIANSPTVSITINQQSSGGGGGGGGGGSGSGTGGVTNGGVGGNAGGSGGTFVPAISTQTQTGCVTISNYSANDQVTFQIDNVTFKATDNFITPNDTGVTINGATYTLSTKNLSTFSAGGLAFYADITQLSYLPIQHTVTMQVCRGQQPKVPPSNITITITPKSGAVYENTTTLFSANVTGGSGNYTYQWMNFTPGYYSVAVTGANSNTLNIKAGRTPGSFTYFLKVTDKFTGAVFDSSNVIFTVYKPLTVFVTASNTTESGTKVVTISANATGGSGLYTFQWYSIANNKSTEITGATSNKLTLNGAANASGYYVVVSGFQGSKAQSSLIQIANSQFSWAILIVALMVLVLIAAWFIVAKRRKKQDEEELP